MVFTCHAHWELWVCIHFGTCRPRMKLILWNSCLIAINTYFHATISEEQPKKQKIFQVHSYVYSIHPTSILCHLAPYSFPFPLHSLPSTLIHPINKPLITALSKWCGIGPVIYLYLMGGELFGWCHLTSRFMLIRHVKPAPLQILHYV